MDKELIKIDRNGSKHWKGAIQCSRCGGAGVYYIGVHNGELVPAHPDQGVCYKCNGRGTVLGTWIERTPEYQAKLDAKREAKRAAHQAELDAKMAELEAERKAEEERKEAERLAKEAEKKISQFVGTVNEKLEVEAVYVGSPYFDRPSFYGYGTERCYIHTFKDDHGNKIVWKTHSRGGDEEINEGDRVLIKGTVKAHDDYKGEKQTALIRCKVTKAK